MVPDDHYDALMALLGEARGLIADSQPVLSTQAAQWLDDYEELTK
jgi:hypothetical protein